MSKINKFGKSSFVVAILSFLLVAVLAFGGTYAYFSASAGATEADPFTVGTLNITLTDGEGEAYTMGAFEIIQPGQYILGSETFDADQNKYVVTDQELSVKFGTTNINAYVRIKISAQLLNGEGKPFDYSTNTKADKTVASDADFFQFSEIAGWYKHTDGYLYKATAGADADSTFVSKIETIYHAIHCSLILNKINNPLQIPTALQAASI